MKGAHWHPIGGKKVGKSFLNLPQGRDERTIKLNPTPHTDTIIKQVCNLIPGHMVSHLAKEHGIEEQCRTFDEWSHVVTLCTAQLTHALGLNDVCDNLQQHRAMLATIRGATPPTRNNLSLANKIRTAGMAEALYWKMLEHLQSVSPKFAKGRGRGYLKQFKAAIHAVDSMTIQLAANAWIGPSVAAARRQPSVICA